MKVFSEGSSLHRNGFGLLGVSDPHFVYAAMQTLPSDIIKTSTDDERCFNVVVAVAVAVVVDDVVLDAEVIVV